MSNIQTNAALESKDMAVINDKLYYTMSGAKKKMLCGKNTIVNSIKDGTLEVFKHPIGNLFSPESIDKWIKSRILKVAAKKK